VVHAACPVDTDVRPLAVQGSRACKRGGTVGRYEVPHAREKRCVIGRERRWQIADARRVEGILRRNVFRQVRCSAHGLRGAQEVNELLAHALRGVAHVSTIG
jgi:hypothetical protein